MAAAGNAKPVLAFARAAESRIREHDVIRLRGTLDGYEQGTIGTVVAIWKEDELYEVEFTDPAAVVTVPRLAIEHAPRDR